MATDEPSFQEQVAQLLSAYMQEADHGERNLADFAAFVKKASK